MYSVNANTNSSYCKIEETAIFFHSKILVMNLFFEFIDQCPV